MTQTWCPFAERLLITTQERTLVRVYPTRSIVEHITAGTDSRDWLQHADNNSSVHFLIRIEIRAGKRVAVIYQFMPIEWAAWGNGRFSRNNPFAPRWIQAFLATCPDTDDGRARGSQFLLSSTISIEHEGVVPRPELYTGLMLEADIKLNKWIADTVPTILRRREYIIGHYQIDHINRPFCPGGNGGLYYPFDTIVGALNMPQSHHFPETNQDVAGDFFKFWSDNGGLPIFGYPILPEKVTTLGNGVVIHEQSFERWRMQRQPDGSITGALVEAERLALAGG